MKRRTLRRLFGTELPVAAILVFALIPWLWMMLSPPMPYSPRMS